MFIKIERPEFLASLSKAIGKSAGEWTWYSIVPVWGIIFLFIGIAASCNMPVDFWSADHRVSAILVYVGIFVLNGLVVSVAWPTSVKMYEVLSAPGFGAYAASEGLMDGYVVFIRLVHSVLLFSIFASALGIFVLLLDAADLFYDRAVLAVMIFSTAYAFKMVSHIVCVMQDILWQKGIFDDAADKQSSKLGQAAYGALHGLGI
jgi:hypothetical protein